MISLISFVYVVVMSALSSGIISATVEYREVGKIGEWSVSNQSWFYGLFLVQLSVNVWYTRSGNAVNGRASEAQSTVGVRNECGKT